MIIFSDAHCDPEGLTPKLELLLKQADKDETFVSAGDLANFLPRGLEPYIGSNFVTNLKSALGGRKLIVLRGNHDPLPWCKKLYDGIPNIEVRQELNIPHPNPAMVTHIEHGHRWAIDWRFLRHFAPGLVDFMTDHFPKLWYSLSKRMGWMPSQVKGETKYHLAVLSTWRGALLYAQDKPLTRCVIGHTHKLGAITSLFPHGIDYVIVDCGTVAAGSFIRLITDVKRGVVGQITFESV